MSRKSLLLLVFSVLLIFPLTSYAYDGYSNKTIGVNVYGSVPLVDTNPILELGIGGGMFFDYRFNERFGIQLESFFTTQDGKGTSAAEGSIEFVAIPAATFKIFILSELERIDPYFGVGIGFYWLTEGSIANNSAGFGLGAQIEVGLEFLVAQNLMMGVGGTYRSVGLINTLSGTANATTYMPYTLFGRIGYKF